MHAWEMSMKRTMNPGTAPTFGARSKWPRLGGLESFVILENQLIFMIAVQKNSPRVLDTKHLVPTWCDWHICIHICRQGLNNLTGKLNKAQINPFSCTNQGKKTVATSSSYSLWARTSISPYDKKTEHCRKENAQVETVKRWFSAVESKVLLKHTFWKPRAEGALWYITDGGAHMHRL